MSYAEYGTRIFLTEINKHDQLATTHSGCRLKMQDSSTDLRAWSPNQWDYFRYFRELTENVPIVCINRLDCITNIK